MKAFTNPHLPRPTAGAFTPQPTHPEEPAPGGGARIANPQNTGQTAQGRPAPMDADDR